jgi:hypothetical protein
MRISVITTYHANGEINANMYDNLHVHNINEYFDLQSDSAEYLADTNGGFVVIVRTPHSLYINYQNVHNCDKIDVYRAVTAN